MLVKDNVPRGCWKLGKVISLVSSRDGCIRSAKVSLSSGRVIGRPLKLLFPIEVSENSYKRPDENGQLQTFSPKLEESIHRPMRTAAKHARMKIKQSLSEL